MQRRDIDPPKLGLAVDASRVAAFLTGQGSFECMASHYRGTRWDSSTADKRR